MFTKLLIVFQPNVTLMTTVHSTRSVLTDTVKILAPWEHHAVVTHCAKRSPMWPPAAAQRVLKVTRAERVYPLCATTTRIAMTRKYVTD